MQKYIFILIILLMPAGIFAQKLSFSVVFDPQVTWLNSDSKSIAPEGAKFGFNAGLVMDNYFAENYAFSTGISILQTGGVMSLADTSGFTDTDWLDTVPEGDPVRYHLQYITIPISLKLKSNQIGYNTFFAHLGLNTHMNVRALASVESLDVEDEDIREEIKFFMMSYFIGGGIEYSLGGNTALMAGVYYTSGFLDARQNDNYGLRTNSVALRLGVKF
jgi:hypothetical protein